MNEINTEELGNPTFAFCADVHWRGNVPICRTDDFLSAQKRKMKYIQNICNELKVPLYIAGDFFHRATPSLSTIRMAIEHLPNKAYIIPGQHDLPSHNINSLNRSGLGLLKYCKDIRVFPAAFGQGIRMAIPNLDAKICLLHRFVYNYNAPWEDCGGSPALNIMDEFNDCSLIIVGDNHEQFIRKHKDRDQVLVNCGSIMRTTAKQIDFQPAFYLWYGETNEVKKIPLPIEEGVVTREHIDRKEEKDENIQTFVDGLSADTESLGLDFKKNAREIIEKNNIEETVSEEFWKTIDESEREDG